MNIPALRLPLLLHRGQSFVLWLLASVHMAALFSLLVVLCFAFQARAETACTGVNLLQEMKSENTALYEQVVAEGQQVPNGNGIFWKIEKSGIKPSYLLGTMHVTDPRVLKMPQGAREALDQAGTVVVESDEVLDETRATAILLMKPELTMFTDGNSLSAHLTKEDQETLRDGLKQRGIAFSAVDQMKPWMLMGMVALPACELARKGGANLFLDKQIALDAAKQGKPVTGLETLEEQANAINAIPLDLQLKSLVEAVKLGDRMDDVFVTMTELYLAQEIGVLMPLLRTVAPDGTSDRSGYAEFDRLVITKRNHLMAGRATKIIEQGSAFIAVGAAHLPGDEGLVQLFRKQGFKVTRIE